MDPRTRPHLIDEPWIVRAPNHLGDVVMSLPAVAAAGADVLVLRSLAPILEMAGLPGAILPFERGLGGFAGATRALRAGGYRRGTLLSAAFSAAWLFRCGGVHRLRGTRTDGRGWLLSDRIEPSALAGMHRSDAFGLLLGLGERDVPDSHPVNPPGDRVVSWRTRLRVGESSSRPMVGLVPGSNAPARRWPVERFGELAAMLTAFGVEVVVLGAASERDVTARVSASAPAATDLGGATDLADLAAILSLCDLVVSNDTGPMHLAGAVGTSTVSLWGSSERGEVRQRGARDVPVTGADLPCRPCRRNRCHRRGRGILLADARLECMSLITTQDVLGAVRAVLDRRLL